MNAFSAPSSLIKIAVRAYKRFTLLAFAFIAITIGLIAYSIYLRVVVHASPAVVFLASSPIFLLGFAVIGIAYFGKQNELGDDVVEITKLNTIFRKLTIQYGLVILLIAGTVILVSLLQR